MTDKETIAKLTAEIARLRAALPRAWEMGRDAGAETAYECTPEKHSGATLASHVTGRTIEQEIRALTPPADLAARIGDAQ